MTGVYILTMLACSLAVGAAVFFALCVMTEYSWKEKWAEYAITAGMFVILSLISGVFDFCGLVKLVQLVALVWVPYKWLDFSLPRSFGVLGTFMVSMYALYAVFTYLVLPNL